MNSRESTHRRALWWENVRVGCGQWRVEWPLAVFLVGALIPALFTMIVYLLIGSLAGGRQAMAYAYVGCVVLAVSAPAISWVSDIPVGDANARTFAMVRRGSLPPLAQYTGRAVPMMLDAWMRAVLMWGVLGLLVGDLGLMARVGVALPLLVVTVPLAVMFGFVAIAPAIGNDYQNLVHNLAAGLVTVCSGALFPTTVNPVLDAISQVMPLHHTVAAFRAVEAGRSWLGHMGWEIAVGVGWSLVAVVIYRWFDMRGRRTGQGAFGA